jgi:hypothetical protein
MRIEDRLIVSFTESVSNSRNHLRPFLDSFVATDNGKMSNRHELWWAPLSVPPPHPLLIFDFHSAIPYFITSRPLLSPGLHLRPSRNSRSPPSAHDSSAYPPTFTVLPVTPQRLPIPLPHHYPTRRRSSPHAARQFISVDCYLLHHNVQGRAPRIAVGDLVISASLPLPAPTPLTALAAATGGVATLSPGSGKISDFSHIPENFTLR